MSTSRLAKLLVLSSLAVISVGVLVRASIPKASPPALPAPQSAYVIPAAPYPLQQVIGRSVQGRVIEAYSYGTGPKHLLLVGGIHGGLEWDAVVLAYQMMDYFAANPSSVPTSTTITIIPDLNPDAVYKATGKEGKITIADVPKHTNLVADRFNADGVDLNRNFDCHWQPKSAFDGKVTSAGTAPFSEPEAQALRDFVLAYKPVAVVMWHSQAGAVYASQCNKGILPATITLMDTYARAAGYPAIDVFEAYPTTGAADDWMASIDIPAVTVELTSHDSVDWEKNLRGVLALFKTTQ